MSSTAPLLSVLSVQSAQALDAAARLGVSALLTASTVAYGIVEALGAAWLCWLGVRLLLSAARRRDGAEAVAPAPAQPEGAWSAWRRWPC